MAQAADTPNELSQLIRSAASYQTGQSMQPLRRIEQLIRQSATDAPLRGTIEMGLGELLTGESTQEAKQFACQHLSTIGTERTLPAITSLLNSESTASLACQTLVNHPAPQATAALRDALKTAPARVRPEIISALGDRQDGSSVSLLTKLAKDPDRTLARAAILAMGKIADGPARDTIAELRKQPPADLRSAVNEASMRAAEKLASSGEAREAVLIYDALAAPGQPENVRRGAFEALLNLDPDAGEERVLKTLHGKPLNVVSKTSLVSAQTRPHHR